jgi:glycerophosphoryl diester phosphodiesterase
LDSMPTDWLDTALDLDCVAVVCKHELWNQDHMTTLKRAGLKALAYTVNTQQQVQRLLDLGIDGMITDRVDRFTPEAGATPHPHQG